ncbi:MAG: SDR family oxidoreductase [Alphaproteobacteria bacterium]|nr:SDR family oxidoreductase [Alphaproteobacteria bacterium]
MPSVLIAGANRGIGLEFVRQYTAAGWTVHATARSDAACAALAALDGHVRAHRLEITDPDSIAGLARELGSAPLDVLIANAGVASDLKRTPEQVDRRELLEVVTVNTFAPLHLAVALRPHLERGRLKIAAAMSSLMSSLARNTNGTQYVYRASKTALNAVWTSLAREWRPAGLICVLLRPGFVRTDMTGFKGELDAPESVRGMRKVVASLTLADAGRLIGYDGLDLPW